MKKPFLTGGLQDMETPLADSLRDMNMNVATPTNKITTPLHTETEPKTTTDNEEQKGYWSSLAILSQAHLTYIIAQSRIAVVFIDQHAAHERILYEKLLQAWNIGPVDIQKRLMPLTVEMDISLISSVLKVQNDLLKIGIEIEQSGPEGVLIHSAPALLKDVALQKALIQLGEEMRDRGGSFAMEKYMADICATMACHSAVRAGQALSTQEMKELLEQMDEFAFSSFCPHGRPVFVNYPISRLEKDFGRIPKGGDREPYDCAP